MGTVLLVCVGNASRSQMAGCLFNYLADGKARVISAGTHPADAIDPNVIETMREVGMNISDRKLEAAQH